MSPSSLQSTSRAAAKALARQKSSRTLSSTHSPAAPVIHHSHLTPRPIPVFPCIDKVEARSRSLLQKREATQATAIRTPQHHSRFDSAPQRQHQQNQQESHQPVASASGSGSSGSGRSKGKRFPCVESHEKRQEKIVAERKKLLLQSPEPLPTSFPAREDKEDPDGEEPSYVKPQPSSYSIYKHYEPFPLTYAAPLPGFEIAYEEWGTQNADKSNTILLHTGLSASSHAASTPANPTEGWWEKFIGPGKALDTDKWHIVCTNVIGGCFGSTGPSSFIPVGRGQEGEGERWGTRFPVLSVFDMVRAQFHLMDHLGVNKLYASVGASMGGMQSLAAGYLFPERVGKIVSISGTARSGLSGVALRYAQRSVLMSDPNWNRGFYYDGLPPHTGMKLARQIATITYRSGPEWESRFGRQMRSQTDSPDSSNPLRVPALCPDFLIETYLDHQGESWCLKYDANSFIYVSKAMDLFDMTQEALEDLSQRQGEIYNPSVVQKSGFTPDDLLPPLPTSAPLPPMKLNNTSFAPYVNSLAKGMERLKEIPTLVLGVQSDILFPVQQQQEIVEALRRGGNEKVVYFELGGVWGHDTFLLDLPNVGGAVRGFL